MSADGEHAVGPAAVHDVGRSSTRPSGVPISMRTFPSAAHGAGREDEQLARRQRGACLGVQRAARDRLVEGLVAGDGRRPAGDHAVDVIGGDKQLAGLQLVPGSTDSPGGRSRAARGSRAPARPGQGAPPLVRRGARVDPGATLRRSPRACPAAASGMSRSSSAGTGRPPGTRGRQTGDGHGDRAGRRAAAMAMAGGIADGEAGEQRQPCRRTGQGADHGRADEHEPATRNVAPPTTRAIGPVADGGCAHSPVLRRRPSARS